VAITFAATTGHTATDSWAITATALGCFQVGSGTPVAAAAALTQDIVLFQLPAKGEVSRGRIESSVAATGPTTSVATVGVAGNNHLFLDSGSAYDLMASVSDTNLTTFTPLVGSSTAAAVNVVLNVTTTVQNVSAIAAGTSLYVWLLWAVLP
jgi:hypothetical protein